MQIDLRGPAGAAAYRILTNLVVPRPIAWVSSKDIQGGINLAPFSFFNLMGSDPPIVTLGIGDDPTGRPKHTARNIAATREFVVNLVTEDLMKQMNLTAADFPDGHSELDAAGLHAGQSLVVSVPRVAEARAGLECVLHSIQRIGGNNLVIGEIVALHVADGLIDERLQVKGFTPVGRMGSPSWYSRTTDRFELARVSYAQLRAAETDGNN
jgi:flavin reductase (DIM6/NTAB) family NADH-FMN oxidoreductase RutF